MNAYKYAQATYEHTEVRTYARTQVHKRINRYIKNSPVLTTPVLNTPASHLVHSVALNTSVLVSPQSVNAHHSLSQLPMPSYWRGGLQAATSGAVIVAVAVCGAQSAWLHTWKTSTAKLGGQLCRMVSYCCCCCCCSLIFVSVEGVSPQRQDGAGCGIYDGYQARL